MRRIVFFGGNGHCAARLQAARALLAERRQTQQGVAVELLDAEYPGFEGRPRAASFEDFLEALAQRVARFPSDTVLHGTGIGGLVLLCLRSRGVALGNPVVLHAPVLWGLETRWMPKLVRIGPTRHLLPKIFALGCFQRRFARKQFLLPQTPAVVDAFFEGYARCPAFPDLFDWLVPALLRDLEERFGKQPQALDNIEFWWGGRDQVVSREELTLTEAALGRSWPLREFEDWGHYPMIDDPASWVSALQTHATRLAEAEGMA